MEVASYSEEGIEGGEIALYNENIASDATTQWSKYFDAKSGKYYYYDTISKLTTWDKPAGLDISLSTEALPVLVRPQDQNKQGRSDYIATIFAEKQELKKLRDEESAQQDFVRRLKIWTTEMERAAASANDISLSWIQFGYIDPVIYEYSERFGKNIVTLRLIGLGLTALPDEVGYKLRSLNILNVSNNELVAVPDSILHLTNLRELHLVHNKLKKLPERIGLMGQLCRLEIANNSLEKLPITLAGLTKIERLDAESNRLKILPENLDAMKSCKILNFNHNELTRLPRCLGRMPSLATLSASWNQISYIPEELCASTTLRALRLNLNCISHIPERIGAMTQLHELSLDSNRLLGIPMSFYNLTNLRVLRVENNPHLLSPSVEVIVGGAEGVVKWSHERFKENESARMRYIIQKMIELLGQIETRGIADPAYFEAHVEHSEDVWFALQMEYFWTTLLPELENVWYKELMQGKHDAAVASSFPFSREDVSWAYAHYADAYGPLLVMRKTDFKKCACVDKTGRRVPCIPPRIGYMCNRMCTMLKSNIVLQAEKERRNWIAYQRHSLEDAVKRAEHEAVKYLSSVPGDLWITMSAFQKAEVMMNEKLADKAVEKREQRIEKKKLATIKHFDKRIQRLKASRDKSISVIKAEIERYQAELKDARVGYMSRRLLERIEAATKRITELPEHQMIESLNQECIVECQRIEDNMLDDYDEEGAETGEAPVVKGPKRYEALKVDNRNFGEIVKDDVNIALKGAAEAGQRGAALAKEVDRTMRVAADIAEIRVRKVMMVLQGDFAEIQREMKHELYTQYVNTAVSEARRKAEDSFRNIDIIRQAFQGRDIELLFNQWKEWVRTKKRQARRDLRHECRREVRGFDSALESVNIVNELLDDWVELEDLYSEKPYWQNTKTGQMVMERPGVEHYLPLSFRIPTPPKELPPDVSLDSSSDESTSERKKHRRNRRLAKRRGAKEQADAVQHHPPGITIEGEIQVSDSDSDDDDSKAKPKDRKSNTALTEVVTGFVNQKYNRLNIPTADYDRQPSNYSMPTVTTARTGAFGGSFTFASSFKKYKGESFYSGSFDEHGSASGSFYGLHVADSSADLSQFLYGPDQLRAKKGIYTKTGMKLVNEELYSKLEQDHNVDPRVLEMRQRLEAAEAFKSTETYAHNSILHGGALIVGELPTEGAIEEIKDQAKSGARSETGIAERKLLKVQNAPKDARHDTYIKQMSRKAVSHQQIKEAREAKEAQDRADEALKPIPEELLYFAGGDNRMTWVKGEKGMKLRTVLAHRALHVEKVLHEEAVKKGFAAPKKTNFIERELAPLFKEGLSSSSEDDDEDEEARTKRVERKKAEQKRILLMKRGDEEKRAMEALRIRRLKEKYTR